MGVRELASPTFGRTACRVWNRCERGLSTFAHPVRTASTSSMSWAYAYLSMAAVAFLPRLALQKEPLLPFNPPARVWWARLRAIFDPAEHLTLPVRVRLLFRWLLLLFDQAFWHFWWTLDDLFVPAYRDVELKGAVFIVGGFRTGSTSLHRTLALDEERFVCPRMMELIFPFLVVHYFFDYLEWLDQKVGTRFIAFLDGLFQRFCGEELNARHPMSYHAAEEDDVLFASIYGVGWYAGIQFPSQKTCQNVGQISKFTKVEKDKCFHFYKRVMQKVLLRRGNGRLLLSKSHMVDFVPALAENIPGAKFVDIVRHPKDSFVSWFGLQEAGARILAHTRLPLKEAVKNHCEFWHIYFAQEMEHFNGPNVDSKSRTQLTFSEYYVSPEKVVRKLYANWGWEVAPKFATALAEYKREHQDYKNKNKYRNPTLKQLGLGVLDMEEMFREYINTVCVSDKLSPIPPESPHY